MQLSKPWDYYKDQLTKLPNRYALIEYLQSNASHRMSIFVVNIDNFSAYNRLYGYLLGDAVLVQVAHYLKSLALPHMRLFRFDGDQFVFVTQEFMDFRRIDEFSKGVISFFEHIDIDLIHAGEEISLKVYVSIGVAMGNGLITLDHAQIAIKEARKNSKSAYNIYEPQSKYVQKLQENVYWINMIKKAIEEENVVAYYQPIQNMHTGKIEKFECLARINEESVVISPERFIEAARLSGTYALITRTIIKKAFAEFEGSEYAFSINITACDVRLGYLEEFLLQLCKRHDINPSRVVLELLENIVSLTEEDMLEQLQHLRRYGFQIAIDDFGMENSNFSRLLELHPDYIKIDGAFIKNILQDKKSRIIVDAIVMICKESDIKVIAEFVSEKAIYEYLQKIGVDYAQGYFIGKPIEHVH